LFKPKRSPLRSSAQALRLNVDRLPSSARMALATASRVTLGWSELAINMPPRVKAQGAESFLMATRGAGFNRQPVRPGRDRHMGDGRASR
jgi:hypothetical protein